MLPQISPAESPRRLSPTITRWGTFLGVWGLITAVWCGLLPLIALRPAIKARLDDLEARGIDASAMYYSELPAMDDVLHILQEFRERHPTDLWVPIWSYTDRSDANADDGSPAKG